MRTASGFAEEIGSTGGQRPPMADGALPLLGHALELWRDPLAGFMNAHREHGDVVGFRFGPYDFTGLLEPELIRQLVVRQAHTLRRSPTYGGLKVLLGNGLLTSDGEFWRKQRKLMQPAFHHKRLARLADTMSSCSQDLVGDWDAGDDGAEFDVMESCYGLTLRIVGHTLFGTEFRGDAGRIAGDVEVAIEHANHVGESLYAIPEWVPTPRNLRFGRAKRNLHDLVDRVVHERRELRARDRETPGDLLDMLMAVTDESGNEGMSDAQLRDEVLTLAMAGHETTANLLTWAFVCLSRHPEVRRRLERELDEVLGDRAPTYADLAELQYVGQVINETLRLYPPAWLFERLLTEELEIGGYTMGANSLAGVCIYSLHRHPDLWDNPEGFDPDRFTPERSAGRHKFAFIPFGAGPRVCIGNAFALMEAKLCLATIAQRYRLDLRPGQTIKLDPGITLRPGGKVLARRHRRGAS